MKVAKGMITHNVTQSSSGNDYSQNQKEQHKSIRNKRKGRKRTLKGQKITELCGIKLGQQLINDLNNYGPAGLIHMNALSSVIDRPIRVWKSKDQLPLLIIGQSYKHSIERPVNVEYHNETSDYIGHWTLLGNKDPINNEKDLNSCLFTVIAAQVGRDTNSLKADVIDFLTTNAKHLIRQIDDLRLDINDNDSSLLFGGARYNGTSPRDTAIILNNSQNNMCYGCRDTGHPRGHASNKNATGPKDSVENYSRSTGSMKSGFLSVDDQNKIAHIALLHEESQSSMAKLNNGSTSETITLSRNALQNHSYQLPKMKEYYNGEEYSETLDIMRITLVLRHHRMAYDNPDADVFVHTFYPRCN